MKYFGTCFFYFMKAKKFVVVGGGVVFPSLEYSKHRCCDNRQFFSPKLKLLVWVPDPDLEYPDPTHRFIVGSVSWSSAAAAPSDHNQYIILVMDI